MYYTFIHNTTLLCNGLSHLAYNVKCLYTVGPNSAEVSLRRHVNSAKEIFRRCLLLASLHMEERFRVTFTLAVFLFTCPKNNKKTQHEKATQDCIRLNGTLRGRESPYHMSKARLLLTRPSHPRHSLVESCQRFCVQVTDDRQEKKKVNNDFETARQQQTIGALLESARENHVWKVFYTKSFFSICHVWDRAVTMHVRVMKF